MSREKRKFAHKNPQEIFSHAETWWITNFLAADQVKKFIKMPIAHGEGIEKAEYGGILFSTSATCQALSLELYFKCIQCIETGYFHEGHHLSSLFKLISAENQDKIIRYHDEIAKKNQKHQEVIKFEKKMDFSFSATLERSSQAFEKFRYSFERNNAEIYISNIVHATKKLIQELHPEWKALMSPA